MLYYGLYIMVTQTIKWLYYQYGYCTNRAICALSNSFHVFNILLIGRVIRNEKSYVRHLMYRLIRTDFVYSASVHRGAVKIRRKRQLHFTFTTITNLRTINFDRNRSLILYNRYRLTTTVLRDKRLHSFRKNVRTFTSALVFWKSYYASFSLVSFYNLTRLWCKLVEAYSNNCVHKQLVWLL